MKESLEYCHQNNWKCTKSLFLKWEDRYKKNSGDRFDKMAKDGPAHAILQEIDNCKEMQRKLWKSLENAESAMEAKRTLDSILGLQCELLMLYNDVTLHRKMKESFDAEMKKNINL